MTTEAPSVGGAPTVGEVDGQLVIEWPSPKAENFLIRTSLFEAMVGDINAGKRIAAVLDHIKTSLDELASG